MYVQTTEVNCTYKRPGTLNKRETIIMYAGAGLILVALLMPKKTPAKSPKTNLQFIDSLNPKYKPVFIRFIQHIQNLGYRVQINSAYRTFKRQAELKKEDKRNASPGFSPHNYGIALDIQLSKNGKTFGKKTPSKDWINTGIPNIAKSMGLDWGGTIKGYYDPVHFAVANLDTAKLQQIAFKQFNTKDPNKIAGNMVKLAQRGNKQRCGCLSSRHNCVLY